MDKGNRQKYLVAIFFTLFDITDGLNYLYKKFKVNVVHFNISVSVLSSSIFPISNANVVNRR